MENRLGLPSIVVSAPASAMLFGEHAVLRGSSAIAAAIDVRLRVRLQPQKGHVIALHSSLGSVETTMEQMSFGPAFRFVEAVFRYYRDQLPFGCVIHIDSDISTTVGLGSSASVTVAVLAALSLWINGRLEKEELLQASCSVIRQVQGYGSGADAASIIWGGVIVYRPDVLQVRPLCSSLSCVLIFSGYKTPTAEVIRYVNEKEVRYPKIYSQIFSTIDCVVQEAEQAILEQRWDRVGELMHVSQGLMTSLGVNTDELSRIYWQLSSLPTMFGAKISGSGLGDAVIGLGTIPEEIFASARLPSRIAKEGVRQE